MTEVRFYDAVDDELLKFAVILAKTDRKWVFCKHKQRNSFEAPGGHRESGESILDTAKRELREETGAIDFTLKPICAYSVTEPEVFHRKETFGMLFKAEISSFAPELHSEMEKIIITDCLPEQWTYPQIQPILMEEAARRGSL